MRISENIISYVEEDVTAEYKLSWTVCFFSGGKTEIRRYIGMELEELPVSVQKFVGNNLENIQYDALNDVVVFRKRR